MTTAAPAAAPGGRRRWLTGARIRLALGLGAALVIDPSTPLVVLAVFVLVVPFEKLFPRHHQPLRRPRLGMDLSYAILGPLLAPIGLAVAIGVSLLTFAWLPGLLLSPLVALLPGPLNLVAAIVLFDLAIYWSHRWSHEVPFLWRFHAVHHSTEHLDWISGFRNHPVDGALLGPVFVFLIAAGFSPEVSGALVFVQIVIGLFLHANVRWRLRPLHRLIITPEFHHWHHSSQPEAINTNYSVFLPLWDILFRTYHMPPDRGPERYGIAEPMPDTVVGQLLHPLRGLPTPWWVLRHPVQALRRTWAATRRGVAQLARSARRPPRLLPF